MLENIIDVDSNNFVATVIISDWEDNICKHTTSSVAGAAEGTSCESEGSVSGVD